MQAQHFSNLLLAILKEGMLVKSHGSGFANLETQTPLSVKSIVEIASINKLMIGIMQLTEI